MCFTDQAFPYGPFVPHWIPRQYIENYFAWHQLDSVDNLVLNTTVEDVTKLDGDRWKLTLRGFDRNSGLDRWYDETFDAVIIANGHYSVPFVRLSLIELNRSPLIDYPRFQW
jgi:cation diffusion facilitator CzcD-associated flavoprotein CzcO